ncbi:unnamed protein product [Rotaria sordida]|uniref:Uncharacterized protein n=1 Tax=Rotaria sordida TaxID=392033 RepID=A0A815D219_9BILA|nr:unnamed protein product [Rotaria sordida]CAF1568393.1 unnamed protein product [Rotaria sordida]
MFPTSINSTGETNDRISVIVSSFPISTTTIDNKINNNLIGTSLCLQKDKLKLIAKKKEATTQHINIKKKHRLKSILTIQNEQRLSTNNNNHIDDENL